MTPAVELEGQLNFAEREQIRAAVAQLLPKHPVCLEVGTYKGGGSTLQILQTLAAGDGCLFGIEASPEIFREMKESLASREPVLCRRFNPVCGFSQKVIPALVAEGKLSRVDFVFLDGGNNPREQMEEFFLLDPHMPLGSVLMAHDAFLRKGKWLRRFLPLLDHYRTEVLPISKEGLLVARKRALEPTIRGRIKAKLMLLLCQLSPLELAACWTPFQIRALIFRFLPPRWGARIADGRS
jgi:Methyltransferase domain